MFKNDKINDFFEEELDGKRVMNIWNVTISPKVVKYPPAWRHWWVGEESW